jgi:hypothetical protein
MERDPGKRVVAYRSTFLCGGRMIFTERVLIPVFYYQSLISVVPVPFGTTFHSGNPRAKLQNL